MKPEESDVLPQLTQLEANDRIEVIDDSDSSESVYGTRKWIRFGDLVTQLRDALIV